MSDRYRDQGTDAEFDEYIAQEVDVQQHSGGMAGGASYYPAGHPAPPPMGLLANEVVAGKDTLAVLHQRAHQRMAAIDQERAKLAALMAQTEAQMNSLHEEFDALGRVLNAIKNTPTPGSVPPAPGLVGFGGGAPW